MVIIGIVTLFFNWKIAIGILIVAFILTLMMECLLGILLLKIQ